MAKKSDPMMPNDAVDVSHRAKKVTERVADATRSAADEAKRRAEEVSQATVQALEENPLAAIAGAVAIGAVAAAFIPATRRELEALGPLAERVREAAGVAFHAAQVAGLGELTAGGLTMAAASDGFGGIVGKFIKAASASTEAAASSIRQARSPASASAEDTANAHAADFDEAATA